MNIILEPTVTVISVPQFIEHPTKKIPADGSDADKIGAFAAKTCYASLGEEGRPNIDNQRAIAESGHFSVFEHLNFGVLIEGYSRACSLEFNRHRAGLAISQESTRYVKLEDPNIVFSPERAKLYRKHIKSFEYGYLIPHNTKWENNERGLKEFNLLVNYVDTCKAAIRGYNIQVDYLTDLNPYNLTGFNFRKWIRGIARDIMPHCLETKTVYTGNLRTWRHIIQLRSADGAEAEIRRLVNLVFHTLKPFAPTHFEDANIIPGPEDIDIIEFKYSSTKH